MKQDAKIACGMVLGGAAISVAALHALVDTENFRIYEAGCYYLLVFAPTAGAALALAAWLALKKAAGTNAVVLAGLIVSVGAWTLHSRALAGGWIGGEYFAPHSYRAEEETSADLLAALSDRNTGTAATAWSELKRRAETDPDLMWAAIEHGEATSSHKYLDSYRTQEAAEFLASRRDARVIPVLRAMLTSRAHVGVIAQGETAVKKFWTTCESARRLLKSEFPTEPVTTKCGE